MRLEDGPIRQYESDTTQAPRERILDAGNQNLGCSIQFEAYNNLDGREANATYAEFSWMRLSEKLDKPGTFSELLGRFWGSCASKESGKDSYDIKFAA